MKQTGIFRSISKGRDRLLALSDGSALARALGSIPAQYTLLLAAINIEDHVSAPVTMGMLAVAAMRPHPASLPEGVHITGRYICNVPLAGTDARSEVSLMYNVHTGNIVGLPANATRHSFGFNMGWHDIERTRQGVFYWGADMRNKNYYPTLTNALFLLRNGDLVTARLTRTEDGSGYRVAETDMGQMVVFSRTGIFAELSIIASEINELLRKARTGNTYQNEERMYR